MCIVRGSQACPLTFIFSLLESTGSFLLFFLKVCRLLPAFCSVLQQLQLYCADQINEMKKQDIHTAFIWIALPQWALPSLWIVLSIICICLGSEFYLYLVTNVITKMLLDMNNSDQKWHYQLWGFFLSSRLFTLLSSLTGICHQPAFMW